MTSFQSDFLKTLSERGFLHQISDPEGLDAACLKGPITGYIGFDCTADSLHVGSLLQIMMLYWLNASGHRPIALMGSGTTRIGDPTGKDESRKVLSAEEIQHNKDGISRNFLPFFQFGTGPTDPLMVDNADWLLKLNYVDFLRDVGRHFSVNQMIGRDSVKLRLEREQHLSFLEFNYMIFQAYDFLELSRRHGCVLQMGGSDQWGNIVSGVELGRRADNAALFALTSPLMTTASGAKMGKTAAGAVWLSPDRLSPYDFWQFWRNAEDADIERFYKLYTVLPLGEIAGIIAGDINEAKKRLATEVTALVHGRAAADQAAETARATFESGALDLSLPTVEVPSAEFEAGIGLLAALVRAGLAQSNGEARRHVQSGAVRINDTVAADEKALISTVTLLTEGVVKLSVGKKKHTLLKPV
jgi:tyrosyl-tRNA synthetase